MKVRQGVENDRSLAAMRESANRLARRMEAEFVVQKSPEDGQNGRQTSARPR